MKLIEVLDILHNAGIEPYSISRDGDDETYLLKLMYASPDDDRFFCITVHLFRNGEVTMDLLDSFNDWEYVPSGFIKGLAKIIMAWEGYWNEQIVQEAPHIEGLSE